LKSLRAALSLALIGAFGLAGAQVNFSNISATYSMNAGSGTIDWIVNADGTAMTVDFTQNAPAFKVGDSTTFTDGTSRITYDVSGNTPISGIDLLIQGDVEDFGRIDFTESASDAGGSLGSIGDSILGASYSGGANGAFSNVYHLAFSQAVTTFSVTKTFSMDINQESLPSSSLALVGTVEQDLTPVPEPASLAALGIGALALLRRRALRSRR